METIFTLETKAQTTWRGRQGEERDVIVRRGRLGAVLVITGTPGSWYLSTLLGGAQGPRLSIDYGADWWCENIDVLIREASRRLADLAVPPDPREKF